MSCDINKSDNFGLDASCSETFLGIVNVVGYECAEVICNRYGGTRLYVPQKITVGHPLEELLGMEAALKLASNYGGQAHFDIPMITKPNREKRNAEIHTDYSNGIAVRLLARKYHMTERNIRIIVSGMQSIKPDFARLSEMILAGKAAGMTEHSLAIKYGMKITAIRKITNS